MLYSDQPPKPYVAPASFGHSKGGHNIVSADGVLCLKDPNVAKLSLCFYLSTGVVLLDKTSGVWLSHSTPKFPVYRTKAFWPDNGNANAQAFMCVTYPYEQFKEIGMSTGKQLKSVS